MESPLPNNARPCLGVKTWWASQVPWFFKGMRTDRASVRHLDRRKLLHP